MWADYYPTAKIYGLDIDSTALINEGRIASRQCDQTRRADLVMAAQWIGRPLDLIIDDGDHKPASQILAAHTLMPFLSPDGIFIIEDAQRLDILTAELGLKHMAVTFGPPTGPRQDRLVLMRKQDVR